MEINKLIKKEIQEGELEYNNFTDKNNKIKNDFIREIKSGLGDEIKKNPKAIKIIKKTPLQKLIISIKKIIGKI